MHRTNNMLEKLRKGQPVLAGLPTPYSDAKIAEMIGLSGFDCVWIDWEHQDITDHDILHLCMGARAAGCDAMVRTRGREYWTHFLPLELGATGIMVPHIFNADDARWVVRNSRYAPQGLRGLAGHEPAADYTLCEMTEQIAWAKDNILVSVQIEDREGVENVDEIAAVDGVDLLFMGPGDLSQSYGVTWQFNASPLVEARKRIAAAAKANGKWWGAPAYSPESAEALLSDGALFLTWGAAVVLLADGYRRIKCDFDEIVAARHSGG